MFCRMILLGLIKVVVGRVCVVIIVLVLVVLIMNIRVRKWIIGFEL